MGRSHDENACVSVCCVIAILLTCSSALNEEAGQQEDFQEINEVPSTELLERKMRVATRAAPPRAPLATRAEPRSHHILARHSSHHLISGLGHFHFHTHSHRSGLRRARIFKRKTVVGGIHSLPPRRKPRLRLGSGFPGLTTPQDLGLRRSSRRSATKKTHPIKIGLPRRSRHAKRKWNPKLSMKRLPR